MSHNSLLKTAEYFEDGLGALVTLTITNASPRWRGSIDCGQKIGANWRLRPARSKPTASLPVDSTGLLAGRRGSVTGMATCSLAARQARLCLFVG